MSAPAPEQVYPEGAAERTRWILAQRSAPNKLSVERPYAFIHEQERMENGEVAEVSTVFLTNRECPWKCVMCDLWRKTVPAPPGSIPRQLEHALSQLPPATVLKLYNSGSFFDQAAIPRADWNDIVKLCRPFKHLVLECHPALINDQVLEFAAMFHGQLEIAMGLETSHPSALEKLNKRITVENFNRAAAFLRHNRIHVRVFLLVSVPFIIEHEQQHWLQESIRCALQAGANVVSLIPTRAGNGALDALRESGHFREPTLAQLETGHEYGISLQTGRVFADTWDLDRFSSCPDCTNARRGRLARMNLSQALEPRILCPCAMDCTSRPGEVRPSAASSATHTAAF